jgi:Xaa-Pro aminopeptidase
MSTSANNPANNNDKALEVRTHDIPLADAMTEFMKEGWAPSPLEGVTPHKSIPFTTIKEGMEALNQYVAKPYETRQIWEKRFQEEEK